MSVGAIKWDAELKISLRMTKNGGHVFALRTLEGDAPHDADVLCAMTPQDAVGTLAAAVCHGLGLDFGAFLAGIAGAAAYEALVAPGGNGQYAHERKEATANNVHPSEATPAQEDAPTVHPVPALPPAPPPSSHDAVVLAHAVDGPFTVKDAAQWLAEPEHRARKVLESLVSAGTLALGERKKAGQLYVLAQAGAPVIPAPDAPPASPETDAPESQPAETAAATPEAKAPPVAAEPAPVDHAATLGALGLAFPGAWAVSRDGVFTCETPKGRIIIASTGTGTPDAPIYRADYERASDGTRAHTGDPRHGAVAALEALRAKMTAPRAPPAPVPTEPAAPPPAAPTPDAPASPLDALRARHPDYTWNQIIAGTDRSYRGAVRDGAFIIIARTADGAAWLGKAYDATGKAAGTGTPTADIVQAANYVIIAARRAGEALPAAPKPPAVVQAPAPVAQPVATPVDEDDEDLFSGMPTGYEDEVF